MRTCATPWSMKTQDMVVIGLTGGIGSGKSAAANRIREAGVAVIDADQIAREIVEPGSSVLSEIANSFGSHLIDEDGSLCRKELGSIVFSNPEKLAALNAITHPAILLKTQEKLAALQTRGHRWVIYEAALILENDLTPGLGELIAVVCDPEVQLQRVMARDKLDRDGALARIQAQTTNERRRSEADHVLENDGELMDLYEGVDSLLGHLRQAYGEPRSDA